MNSILDAIDAARKRNIMRDQANDRAMPVVPQAQNPMLTFAEPNMLGQGSNDTPAPDTRSPAQMYSDAIGFNKSPMSALPGIGLPIGLVNNAFIADYEKNNPNKASKDPNRMYRSIFDRMMDALTGKSNQGPFGVDNIGAFPTRGNFGNYGDAFGGGPNADIGGSVDTTDQSPSVGTGDDDTAVA